MMPVADRKGLILGAVVLLLAWLAAKATASPPVYGVLPVRPLEPIGTTSIDQPVAVGGIGNTTPPGGSPDVLNLCIGSPIPFAPGCLGYTWAVGIDGTPYEFGNRKPAGSIPVAFGAPGSPVPTVNLPALVGL